jgi:hypothetical protein
MNAVDGVHYRRHHINEFIGFCEICLMCATPETITSHKTSYVLTPIVTFSVSSRRTVVPSNLLEQRFTYIQATNMYGLVGVGAGSAIRALITTGVSTLSMGKPRVDFSGSSGAVLLSLQEPNLCPASLRRVLSTLCAVILVGTHRGSPFRIYKSGRNGRKAGGLGPQTTLLYNRAKLIGFEST